MSFLISYPAKTHVQCFFMFLGLTYKKIHFSWKLGSTRNYSCLPNSACLRPMLLNTVRMRMVARRTPHRNRASGLDATRWCTNASSLLRRSEMTSGHMCSVFFSRKPWKMSKIRFHVLHPFIPAPHTERGNLQHSTFVACIHKYKRHSTTTVVIDEGAALIIYLGNTDFPGFSQTGLSHKVTVVPVYVTVVKMND